MPPKKAPKARRAGESPPTASEFGNKAPEPETDTGLGEKAEEEKLLDAASAARERWISEHRNELGRGRVDWLRVKYSPGSAHSSDLLAYGRIVEFIPASGKAQILVIQLHKLADSEGNGFPGPAPEAGALNVVLENATTFGYETSYAALKEQENWRLGHG